MKQLYIVANWKSNMHLAQSTAWLDTLAGSNGNLHQDNKTIIVCPPFTLLQSLMYKIGTFNSQIKVGAQNISPYDEGAYTGEIAASLLSEFCSYVIVGHSERREKFAESDAMLADKVVQATENNLIPIYCVQDEKTSVPKGVTIAAYEPTFAIGTGAPDTPENAQAVIQKIKATNSHLEAVLYGGSVTAENVNSFTENDSIDGVLVGSASLDAHAFVAIIRNA